MAARNAGRPGFLLGDMTGLGKTLAVWCAVAAMPEREVLIVCPKGAIPQWRRTIALAGCPEKAVTLINYERTKSLMAPPADSKRSAQAREAGRVPCIVQPHLRLSCRKGSLWKASSLSEA